MNSIFLVSLDFELHWGGFEKWPLNKQFRAYFDRTRHVIPKILKAFERTHVHCTWATVGLLLHGAKDDLKRTIPDIKPTYINKQLSAYQYLTQKGIGGGEKEDPYHFADSLVRQIIEVPGQELASHSYAHYYCNEPGQTGIQFLADGQAWNKAAEKYNVQAKSLIFPRNQYNSEYLKVCRKLDIKIVRINPLDWWWKINSTQQESKWKRLNRGMDAYFNIGGKTSYPLNNIKKDEGVYLLPASRLFRPYKPKELFLNRLKVDRIKKEMTRAAKNNEFYHLWWHPHNFGHHTRQNMNDLVEILNHYQSLRNEYGMLSLNMGEIADLLKNA